VKKKYPECDKMIAVSKESQAIGNFLEWLGEQGILLAEYGTERYHRDQLMPKHISIEKLLAEYFEIDLDKVETERRAMLDDFRKDQEANTERRP
jgi:hypothetical protein